ncbi:MAG: hypothetical protein N2322_02755, partial [Terrimicrobiaceae bacterium]|nr:hypothetical protein [Terrimicrobiaceae bacterium]
HLSISPAALESLGGRGGGGGGRGWRLAGWSCPYGTFEIQGFGGRFPGAAGQFMLGAGASGLELALWDVTVCGSNSESPLH